MTPFLLLAPLSALLAGPVDIHGWGPLRFGMTQQQVAEAAPSLAVLLSPPVGPSRLAPDFYSPFRDGVTHIGALAFTVHLGFKGQPGQGRLSSIRIARERDQHWQGAFEKLRAEMSSSHGTPHSQSLSPRKPVLEWLYPSCLIRLSGIDEDFSSPSHSGLLWHGVYLNYFARTHAP